MGGGQQINYPKVGPDLTVLFPSDLMVDSKNNTWISLVDNGLIRWSSDGKEFMHYTTGNGFPSNNVMKAIEDKQGGIWVTTSKGLVHLIDGGPAMTVYTSADGLLSDQFNYSSGFRDSLGYLYFGSLKGMISFDPSTTNLPANPPPLYFTSLEVTGAPPFITVPGNIELPHHQSTLSIGFAALDFSASDKIKYYYMLDGLNSPWVPLDVNQKVNFIDLPPGNYNFRVRAELPGRWQSAEQNLSIKITPPFWQTWWAYSLYAAFAVSLLIAYVRYSKNQERLKNQVKYVKQLKRHNREIRLKNEELQLMFNSLEQSHMENTRIIKIVAHDLKNPIGGIKSLSVHLLKKDIPELVRGPLELIRDACANSMALINELLVHKKEVSDLQNELVDIGKLLTQCVELLQEKATEKKQQLIGTTEFALVRVNRQKIWRAVSNIINNAIKFSPDNADIHVRMEKKDITVLISVQDSGIGIPEALKEKMFTMSPEVSREGTAGELSHGLGLSITKQIVEEHNGNIWFESKEGKGSVFFIELPLAKG